MSFSKQKQNKSQTTSWNSPQIHWLLILQWQNGCQSYVQVFCTSLNGNTYGTKYRPLGYKSDGQVTLAK